MAWFRRKKKKNNDTLDRASDNEDVKHLIEFTRSRTGVEAFIEPRTTVTETTVMLIAHDGEWTRRRIGGVEGAFKFGHKNEVPVYEVAKVGYPQRKRDYDKRRKIMRQRGET